MTAVHFIGRVCDTHSEMWQVHLASLRKQGLTAALDGYAQLASLGKGHLYLITEKRMWQTSDLYSLLMLMGEVGIVALGALYKEHEGKPSTRATLKWDICGDAEFCRIVNQAIDTIGLLVPPAYGRPSMHPMGDVAAAATPADGPAH